MSNYANGVFHDLTCILTLVALVFWHTKEQWMCDAAVDTSKTIQIQYIQFLRTSKSITHALPKSPACSRRQIYAVKKPTCLIPLFPLALWGTRFYFSCIITTNLFIRSPVTDGKGFLTLMRKLYQPASFACLHAQLCICLLVTSCDWSLITKLFYSNVTHIVVCVKVPTVSPLLSCSDPWVISLQSDRERWKKRG